MYTVELLHRSDICSLIFIKATALFEILAVLGIFNIAFMNNTEYVSCRLL